MLHCVGKYGATDLGIIQMGCGNCPSNLSDNLENFPPTLFEGQVDKFAFCDPNQPSFVYLYSPFPTRYQGTLVPWTLDQAIMEEKENVSVEETIVENPRMESENLESNVPNEKESAAGKETEPPFVDEDEIETAVYDLAITLITSVSSNIMPLTFSNCCHMTDKLRKFSSLLTMTLPTVLMSSSMVVRSSYWKLVTSTIQLEVWT